MKIIFYCQYVFGMGHFFRSLEIARALSGHDVTLVVGGRKVSVDLPAHVTLVRLPALYMDEKFTTLYPAETGLTVEEIKGARQKLLVSLFEQQRPDLFMVELFPFGRSIFAFELIPLLQSIRAGDFGPLRTVCSLRDVLVEKKVPAEYEQRVLDHLDSFFDLLLVHSDNRLLRLDETFSRAADIRIPVEYTGFVTKAVVPEPATQLRSRLGLSANEKLIVASAGGGRSGYRLLDGVIDACRLLDGPNPVRLELFAGPFMDSAEYRGLEAKSGGGIHVRRFSKNFASYLTAADLSISMAGYNTCMNLLVARVPSLVYPYRRQQEQPLRAEKIKDVIPMKILEDRDLAPPVLSGHIRDMLKRRFSLPSIPLNLSGAENTARLLTDLVG